MELAVRHYIATHFIFAPSRRQCHSVHDLNRLTARALAVLRERYGEIKPEHVPQTISKHWAFIVNKQT